MRGSSTPASMEAFILAGGRSRRMGQDKTEMRLGSHSLLHWVSRAVRNAGMEATVVREDRVPGLGPLGGVSTAGHMSSAEHLVIFSCDMPFVSADIVQRLQTVAQEGGSSAICQLEETWCLPFVFERSQLSFLDDYLKAGERSIGGLLATIPCQRVRMPVGEEWRFLNINTRNDLEQAERCLGRI